MKFLQLAAVLTVLLASYGDVQCGTDLQEDCPGKGNLTAAVRLFHLVAARRDAFRLHIKTWKHYIAYFLHFFVYHCLAKVLYDNRMNLLTALGFLSSLQGAV